MLKTILRFSSVMTLLGGAVSSTVACGDDNNFNLGNYQITSIQVEGEQTKHFSNLTAFAKTGSASDVRYDYYVIAHTNNDQLGELVEGGYDVSPYYKIARPVSAKQIPSFPATDENILHLWKVVGHPKSASNPTDNFLFMQTENRKKKQKELWYSPVDNGQMTGLKQFEWTDASSTDKWTDVQNVKTSQGFLVLQMQLKNGQSVKYQNLLLNTNIVAKGTLPFGVYDFPRNKKPQPTPPSKLAADNPASKIKLIYYDYQNQNLLWESDSTTEANNLLWSHIAMQEAPTKPILSTPFQPDGFNNIVNNIYWSSKQSYLFIATTNGILAAAPKAAADTGYQTPIILTYNREINNNINYFSYDNSTSGSDKFIIESNHQNFYDIKADTTNWQWDVAGFGGTEGLNQANFIRNGDFAQSYKADANSPFFLIGSRSYGLFIKDSITSSFIRTNRINYNCLSAVAFSKQIIITSSLNSGLFLITS